MKAKYYRETPVLKSALHEFENLGADPDKLPVYKPDPRFVLVPAGAINCRADSWMLALQGTAEAVDDECIKKVAMSPAEKVRRYERQKALEAGKLTGDPKIDGKHS